jgi:hypothetical protein
MIEKWYAIVNDMIGGWAVGTVDKSTSEYDNRPGSTDGRIIADFVNEEDAKEICRLHNQGT